METTSSGDRIEFDALARRQLSTVEALTVACRILAAEGHAPTLAGQVTARAGKVGRFVAPPFHLSFDELRPADFVTIDDELEPVDGGARPNPATRFHLWIYRRRPDVGAIIHTHPPAISALSMLGEPLIVSHMDAMPFHDDCAHLATWPGVPVADEEGRIISEALGDKRAILLAHHGQLTVGADVAEALYLAIAMERAAELQLRARAAGTIRDVEPGLAAQAHDFMVQDSIVAATFEVYVRRALRLDPTCLELAARG